MRSWLTLKHGLLLGSTIVAATGFSSVDAFTGNGTTYGLNNPSGGNCNYQSDNPALNISFAALNKDQWNNTMNCGRCAQVSCIDSRCTSTESQLVYIIDQCPGCEFGDLDLSPGVFETITGMTPSRIDIQWDFVECPMKQQHIEYCLKDGSNAHWAAIQPTNFTVGIASVTINGELASLIGSAYYFLVDDKTTDLSSVKIEMTSVAGEEIKDVVALVVGECVEGNSQFTIIPTPSPSSTTKQTSTTEPPTTQAPTTTEHPTTQPPTTTEPPTTQTPSTQPPTTQPPTTQPPTTQPPTTQPPTTQPPTTQPPTTTTPTPSPSSTATPTQAPTPTPSKIPSSTAQTPTPTPSKTPSSTTQVPNENSPATTVPTTHQPTTSPPATTTGTTSSPSTTQTPTVTTPAPTTSKPPSATTSPTENPTDKPLENPASTTSSTSNPPSTTAPPTTAPPATDSPASNNEIAGSSTSINNQSTIKGTGATVVVSVLAILAVLFLAVVFIIIIVIRKKKQLKQQLEEEKMASDRYSSDSSYQANVVHDEQVTYAYTAIATPQTVNPTSI